MTELELKFQVADDQVSSLQDELRLHGAQVTHLLARYFDTPDGRLAGSRLALRLRKEGGRWVQTLKADGVSAIERLEHEVALQAPLGTEPLLDPSRHDHTAAGALLRKALDHGEQTNLVERFTVDVQRLACDLPSNGSRIEAALDLGVVRAGERSARICELELEHKTGEREELFALATRWTTRGGLWLSTRSKSARGVALANDVDHGPAVKARPPKLGAERSGSGVVRAVLRSALDQVLANASEVAAGSTNAEHIHQLRVGLRRLRTALRELSDIAEGFNSEWEAALAQAFASLGAVRDEETAASAVAPVLMAAGAPKRTWQAPDAEPDVGAVVRDAAFQATLLDLLRFAHQEEKSRADRPSASKVLGHVGDRLSKLHRGVVRAGKRFAMLPASEQHRVRKRLKRLRYLAEFVETFWPHKPVRRYLRHLEPAQDALGHHNDVAVAQQKFSAESARDSQALFAAGYLQAHLAVTARAAHRALKEVSGARPFWTARAHKR